MTYNPFQIYVVAWDWILAALYWGIAGLAFVAVVAVVIAEMDSGYKPPKQRQSRLSRFLDALSQAGNVLIYDGDQNHSISGDAYRYQRKRMMAVANWLFRDPEHCKNAHHGDIAKASALLAEEMEAGR